MVAEEKKDEDSVQRSLERQLKREGHGRKGSSTGGTASSTSRSATTNNKKKTKDDALAHLVRYETMVRQQEAEDMATLAYMKPCIERLLQLAEIDKPAASSSRMDQTLSFQSLKVAREKLDAIERDPARQTEEREFLATDRQLLMVLRILTKEDEDDQSTTTLTWAEFVQCYKVCIAGMLTLQQLAAPAPAPPAPRRGGADPTIGDPYGDSLSLASLRSRTRDRTISMMTLFGPSSTRMLNSTNKSSSRSSSKTSTSTTFMRALGFILKGVLVLVLAATALVGASWAYYHWTRYGASMRARNKPPRFVPLTSLYPPHFYNTSPLSTTSGSVVVPTSSRGLLQPDAFASKTPSTRPKGIIPSPRAAGRFFAQPDHPPPSQSSGDVATQDASRNHHPRMSVWQHAIGGAVAMPIVTQLLFPPAVAGRFVATASLLTVAAVGIATNLLATLCGRAIVTVRQWLQSLSASRP